MTSLEAMIAAQAQLQVDMGFNIKKMNQAERIEYIHANATNVVSEVMEALAEVDWKPWTKGQDIREDACFGELRDAWQCLTNMMLAVKVGDTPGEVAEQLHDALIAKHTINRERIKNNYDGHSTKCRRCKRALDDTTVECYTYGDGGGFCAVAGISYAIG